MKKFVVLRAGVKVAEASSWEEACTRLMLATERDDRASLVTFHWVDGQWWLRSVLDVVATQTFNHEMGTAQREIMMALIGNESP